MVRVAGVAPEPGDVTSHAPPETVVGEAEKPTPLGELVREHDAPAGCVPPMVNVKATCDGVHTIETDRAEKFAVRLSGALIVTVVEALPGLLTFPLQPMNAYPVFAVALMGTTVPAS
jgi:hypothetical protein